MSVSNWRWNVNELKNIVDHDYQQLSSIINIIIINYDQHLSTMIINYDDHYYQLL
jgi:ABC-type Fe2+-enterobactin transport system substrate-binding protein